MMNNTLVNKRIFAIEDDLDQLLVITNTLAYYGASFCYAPWNAYNIINLTVYHLPIDLILLDLMFPDGVTGYTVLAHIRSHPLLRNIPVVAVSARDPVAEIPKAKEAGFAGFIAKPIIFEEFAGQLVDILNGRQVWIS